MWFLFSFCSSLSIGFPGGSEAKNLPAKQETQVWSLGQEDPLEKEMATHYIILAWEIPWTEEPGGLWSIESQKSGHDLVTKQNECLYLDTVFALTESVLLTGELPW